ncbi:DUF2591 domain-containing protein [Xenorhabdus bovienii]|uniref:phage protein NinX family protein n=1 Tax=Xenorhabdus bovienii TaxID=40576 RepID=UPI0023B2F9DC|nr:phage protein NinX family protein [Xenorhabdus bovienii]MDE9565962.1 DUF2591 domain-containing protein [Xenorhabdus bovienii]
MKIKTSELIGRALDWAVACCDGFDINSLIGMPQITPEYSTDWSECGPLIEKYTMDLTPFMGGTYCAGLSITTGALCPDDYVSIDMYGKTPQIAICRAVVAARWGDEVEIPDELVEGV